MKNHWKLQERKIQVSYKGKPIKVILDFSKDVLILEQCTPEDHNCRPRPLYSVTSATAEEKTSQDPNSLEKCISKDRRRKKRESERKKSLNRIQKKCFKLTKEISSQETLGRKQSSNVMRYKVGLRTQSNRKAAH